MAELLNHSYALLIGVGESAYKPLSLPVTVKDTQAIYAALIDPELCAYPNDKEHIRVLNNAEATRNAILDGLKWLKDKVEVDKNATVLVYYSGHGWVDKTNDHYYLLQHDVKPTKLAASALSAEAFTDALRQIPAERLLVVIDSCHAAGMATSKDEEAARVDAELLEEFEDFKRIAPSKGIIDALKQGKGRVVFTSSEYEQKSWIKDTSISIYTYHFLEALQGAANKPGETKVKVSNLMNYLSKAVPESARQLHSAEQTPHFDFDTGDFAIALLQGGNGLPDKGWDEVKPEAIQKINKIADVINQYGKYITNINEANNLHIGDVINNQQYDKPSNVQVTYDKGWDLNLPPQVKEPSNIEIPVYFATDRKREDNNLTQVIYEGSRNPKEELEFGLAKVSIPADHRMGYIERPKWWKLEFSEDINKHIVLLNIESWTQEYFQTKLRESLFQLEEPEILLFIHGYNTSFKDAILRTAQITHDLKFLGTAICYSWPSAARLEMYPSDENNIEWTIPHLKEFVRFLLTMVGAKSVNAIAHSMGNRALARVIKETDLSALSDNSASLRHIIFAAPDIDADVFKQFAKDFYEKANFFTLYASSNDKALSASKKFHGGLPRAGDSGQEIVIVDGIDTIDASLVDTSLIGHSYFGDNRSVISDIFYLIKNNLLPGERVGLVAKKIRDLRYWLFQP
ncbi:MAG TPA: alpha/beta hydrolase [Oculatellaceae cyanobacterium]|jgi:esterase/lipase superfamily enzyme